MTRFTTALAAATCILLAVAMPASAQTQASGLHALAPNSTPIVKPVACQGWGPYCPPGFVRACGPYRCWCRPCY